jgi:hypothetical protein
MEEYFRDKAKSKAIAIFTFRSVMSGEEDKLST